VLQSRWEEWENVVGLAGSIVTSAPAGGAGGETPFQNERGSSRTCYAVGLNCASIDRSTLTGGSACVSPFRLSTRLGPDGDRLACIVNAGDHDPLGTKAGVAARKEMSCNQTESSTTECSYEL